MGLFVIGDRSGSTKRLNEQAREIWKWDLELHSLPRAKRSSKAKPPPQAKRLLIEGEFSYATYATTSRVFHLPYAFTEQGVAMLSGVLTSSRAIKVNVEIMRAFVRLRKILASHAELARKLEELEKKYDSQFKAVFDAIRQLMAPRERQEKKIGFQLKEKRAAYRSRR
jgi:chromosome condensin MukBEF ATPase and DNA-binding subunit MukB